MWRTCRSHQGKHRVLSPLLIPMITTWIIRGHQITFTSFHNPKGPPISTWLFSPKSPRQWQNYSKSIILSRIINTPKRLSRLVSVTQTRDSGHTLGPYRMWETKRSTNSNPQHVLYVNIASSVLYDTNSRNLLLFPINRKKLFPPFKFSDTWKLCFQKIRHR